MNADAHFTIGKSHPICQDYAKALFKQGGGDGVFFAFLSDGCSSAPDTDVGARLLVTAAIYLGGWEPLHPGTVINHAASEKPKGVNIFSLDATFLSLVGEPHQIKVRVSGDGVVAGLRRDGSLDVWDVAFPSGAPGYPSYLLDPTRLKGYLAEGHGKRKITVTHDGVVTDTIEDVVGSSETWDFQPPLFTPDTYRAVFAFSDGVHSFQREVGTGFEPVPMLDVVKQLTAIKGFAGEFMRRRMQAFLTRFCRDNKWQHGDDLSAVAIDLGDLT